MMVSNRNLLFQGVIFRCHVSFREGMLFSWRVQLTFTRFSNSRGLGNGMAADCLHGAWCRSLWYLVRTVQSRCVVSRIFFIKRMKDVQYIRIYIYLFRYICLTYVYMIIYIYLYDSIMTLNMCSMCAHHMDICTYNVIIHAELYMYTVMYSPYTYCWNVCTVCTHIWSYICRNFRILYCAQDKHRG